MSDRKKPADVSLPAYTELHGTPPPSYSPHVTRADIHKSGLPFTPRTEAGFSMTSDKSFSEVFLESDRAKAAHFINDTNFDDYEESLKAMTGGELGGQQTKLKPQIQRLTHHMCEHRHAYHHPTPLIPSMTGTPFYLLRTHSTISLISTK
jgi:hypothetical protein